MVRGHPQRSRILDTEREGQMKRITMIIAGSYAALLAVIFGLSWVLRAERRKKCIPLPQVPEKLSEELSDLASRATKTAANLSSWASQGAEEVRSAAQRVVNVIR
jgi:hypothetical protein